MAKPLIFQLGESRFSFAITKVDRSKLYGSKEVQALDEANQVCDLATLAGDGCTLIGRGGTGLGWLDADGSWCEKSQLIPVDKEGNRIEPVESSFGAPIKLFDVATEDEYLEHNIRMVYAMELEQADGEAVDGQLVEELQKGTIFKFPYSFRGGLEADAAFLLTNEAGEIMMAVGSLTQIEFIELSATAATVDEGGAEDEEVDLMDFDMI